MNSYSFIGRLGRDAETRNAGGTDVTSFAVAVDVGYGQNKTTMWVDCAMWGDRGTKVADYIRKGDRIGVTGQLSMRSYEKNGETKSVPSVRVDDITLLGDKKASTGGGSDSRERQGAPARNAPVDDLDNEEIPFASNRSMW